MSGKYSHGVFTDRKWGPLKYSDANALAVTQEAMAGTWSTNSGVGLGMSIAVDASGNLTGNAAGSDSGVCSLSGTLLQTESGTSHNMFNLTLKASNAATGSEKACQLDQVTSYGGLAAVIFVSVSVFPEEGAYRMLGFHAGTDNGAFLTNFLQKR
jgi:hypothetical protein